MYESITKYLPMLSDNDIRNWWGDKENDGSLEHPMYGIWDMIRRHKDHSAGTADGALSFGNIDINSVHD